MTPFHPPRPIFKPDTTPTDPDPRGVFLVFEGGDSCGKTTQLEMLTQALHDAGIEPVVTREPGGSPLGEQIRDLVLNPKYHVDERTEALLYAADRAAHVSSVVRPALRKKKVVVSDRYMDSSIAYQGVGRNLGVERIAGLSQWATDDLQPDMTFVLDMDPSVALERRSREKDRMESQSMEFHQRVRQGFLDRAASFPQRYTVIDATDEVDAIHRAVVRKVIPLLEAGRCEASAVDALRQRVGGAQ